MPVVECRYGNTGRWTDNLALEVRDVYKFTYKTPYNNDFEHFDIYKGDLVKSFYTALVAVTKE
ncbi:hypothetical protein D3C85_1191530 [compost metagenome]